MSHCLNKPYEIIIKSMACNWAGRLGRLKASALAGRRQCREAKSQMAIPLFLAAVRYSKALLP